MANAFCLPATAIFFPGLIIIKDPRRLTNWVVISVYNTKMGTIPNKYSKRFSVP